LNLSSQFKYKENIKAAYVNYDHRVNKRWTVTAGLRFEQTNSQGQLLKQIAWATAQLMAEITMVCFQTFLFHGMLLKTIVSVYHIIEE